MIKEELKQFKINIDDIKLNGELFDNIQKAVDELRLLTLKDKFEVVLNNNLIECKEKLTNFRTILGCRISYENLDRNISFLVREDNKPSYEELEERIDKAIEYLDDWLFNVGGMGACMEYRDIKEILEILKGDNNE